MLHILKKFMPGYVVTIMLPEKPFQDRNLQKAVRSNEERFAEKLPMIQMLEIREWNLIVPPKLHLLLVRKPKLVA